MDDFGDYDMPQAVVVIENIAWNIKKSDIVAFFSPICTVKEEWIHIPIDTFSGKTKPDAFIEVRTTIDAMLCQGSLKNRILNGRLVRVRVGNFEELMRSLLPESINDVEVSRIIGICSNYKVHFSRKCPERPFEYSCSMLRLVPWYKISKESYLSLKRLRDYIETKRNMSTFNWLK